MLLICLNFPGTTYIETRSALPHEAAGASAPRRDAVNILRYDVNHEMTASFRIGHRLSFDGALCTVRYIGPVAGTQKEWLGVEWDDPSRGKHDGMHEGVRYFECRALNA